MSLQLGLTGDVMFGRLVDEAQRQRPVAAIWDDLRRRLQTLDGLLINLECCLSTRGTPWQRTNRPFHFRADPEWAIPALEIAEVSCCALANNHVLDFEVPALRDTLEHLDEAAIAHAGAGETKRAAFEPATVRMRDRSTGESLDVAVVSLTDNTPEYAATETSPGTAHVRIDVDDSEVRSIVQAALGRATATDPDLLVASLHWGPNMVTEPPEAFRRFGRWLVDQGVDLVHGHSAHVPHGIEVHDGAPILYDCGDFVDDYAVDRELRNDRSFLFEATVDSRVASGRAADAGPRPITELRLHPTEIHDRSVRTASPRAAEWVRERMRRRSSALGTEFERDGDDLVLALAARDAREPDELAS